ncbi:MAG: NUDIX domain-containing protein [bacterium]|nr:NUDIX domain-containing protein [bacterium]
MRVRHQHYKYEGLRTTARGVIINDDKILLIERWRPGLHYYSIPGGGIDEDEDSSHTVVREICEETTLEITVNKLLYDLTEATEGHKHYIYLCNFISGTPSLPSDSEEFQAGSNNRFKPAWVDIKKLPELYFGYWEPIKQFLIDDLKNGFKDNVKITSF